MLLETQTTAVNEVKTTPVSNVVLNDTITIALSTDTLLNTEKSLSGMEAQRIKWEQGAYRTSNLALYAVLAECLVFAGELPMKEAKQRGSALEAFYKERSYKYKKDAPLITRVVRAVFGSVDRRRISTYSLVLRQAQKAGVGFPDLAQWIEDNGGVQEIKLGRSANYVAAKDKAAFAKQIIEGRSYMGFAKSESLSFVADADFMGDACVLLAEQQADGSFGIRAVLRSEGLVNAAFVALYAKQQELQTAALKEIDAANDADGTIAKQA